MSFLREHRWRIAAVVVTLAVIIAGKQYYRDASAGELRWILAPTAQLVSWLTGHDFVYEAGYGWANTDVMFVIAPACAGVNFALAAFLALVLGGLPTMTTWQRAGKWLAIAAGSAYAATLVVNTIRIVIALHMDRPDLHRVEGIVVYFGGLVGLYALARVLARQRLHLLWWLAVPLGAYVTITLVMPIANGAAQRDDFVRHATTVLAGCVAVLAIATIVELVRWSLRRKE